MQMKDLLHCILISALKSINRDKYLGFCGVAIRPLSLCPMLSQTRLQNRVGVEKEMRAKVCKWSFLITFYSKVQYNNVINFHAAKQDSSKCLESAIIVQ